MEEAYLGNHRLAHRVLSLHAVQCNHSHAYSRYDLTTVKRTVTSVPSLLLSTMKLDAGALDKGRSVARPSAKLLLEVVSSMVQKKG